MMEFLGGDVTTVYQTIHEAPVAYHQVAPTEYGLDDRLPHVPNAVGAGPGDILYR